MQVSLLTSALESVKVGGLVAYVTCSPHLSETRGVLEQVLRGRSEFEELDVRPIVASISVSPLQLTGAAKSVQLWPHVTNTDAMFIALLRRHQ